MIPRLGNLMVEAGILTPQQRDQILWVQREHPRPFGAIAEELFGVKPIDVERAWADQLIDIADRVDPAIMVADHDCITLIDRRQAWQFGVLPLSRTDAELRLCTCPTMLVKAVRFAGWRLPGCCSFELAQPDRLAIALQRHYPMHGLDESAFAARPRQGGASQTA